MKLNVMDIKKKLGVAHAFYKEYRQWMKIRARIQPCYSDSKHLVIVPCDPWTVGGSRGDEAMIMAVIHYFRNKYPHIPVIMVSGGNEGDRYINTFPIPNVKGLRLWNGNYPLERIYDGIMAQHPSHVVLLGADCMDGFYSPFISLTLLALHDLFSNTSGIESRMMGFSFNEKPYWLLKWAYNQLNEGVTLNLRDQLSLSRFRKFTKKDAGLVADSAFLLQPSYNFNGFVRLETWVKSRRQNGTKLIIGMNFHPMLRKYNGEDDIKADALIIAKNLETILHDRADIDFVFIPHDNRSCLTDNLMLGEMYMYLCACGFDKRVYYEQQVYRADQLKGICSLIDGIVSSRMHLAIAALGQGRSVMAASYQGKFEGLFQHFNLPLRYILSADKFISNDMVISFFDYIDNLTELNAMVGKELPKVLRLSQNNMLSFH